MLVQWFDHLETYEICEKLQEGMFYGMLDFKKAAELGVTKINIDTDGRLVWTRVHREVFAEHPEVFDLRNPGKIFMAEYAKFIAAKNVCLGSAEKLANVRKLVS